MFSVDFQRASSLIGAGLERLRELGAKGCCLVGHPEYYKKFGFRNPSSLLFPGVPPEAFFVLSFTGDTPQGSVGFHESFQVEGPQG